MTYSKNFVFPSDLLWYSRWNDVLTSSPDYVEIITWNDYGESHYIGPLASTHDDDGASKWVNDMPHDGWRDLAKPFIAAYKAGATAVDDYIEEDQIIYWYRPAPRTVTCDLTDNTMGAGNNDSGNYYHGRPNGWEVMEDAVFVVTLLTTAGTLEVTSGNSTQTFDAPAGASSFKMPMEVGQQKFALTRDSETVMSGTSLKDVIDSCPCGIYNFNAYVGTLPEGTSDPLSSAGLASFTVGLAVETCSATPSLATANVVSTTAKPTGSAAATTTSAAVPTSASGGSMSATKTGSPSTTTTQQVSSAATTRASSTASTKPLSTTTSMEASSATTVQTTQASIASSSAVTTAVVSTTPTSAASQSIPAATSTSTAGDSTCNGGTNASDESSNFAGLCSFACSQGYCPPGPCSCTSYGSPLSYAVTAEPGCPLSGENEGYKGLCEFACARDYCPQNACTATCS